jgi:hypothetical protein
MNEAPEKITHRDEKHHPVEYVRIDIFAAQFAKLEAIRDVVHRWIDSEQGSSPDSMLKILEILYPTPKPTGTKKAGQSNE